MLYVNTLRNKFTIFLLLIFCAGFGQISDSQTPDEYVSNLLNLSLDAEVTNRIKALSYLQEALNMQNDVSDKTLIKLYRTAGIIYKDQDSHYMALNYFYKQLELQDKIDNSESFFIYNNIGGCYYFLHNLKKAKVFWNKALRGYKVYAVKKNNKIKAEGSIIYNNLAVLEKDEGNYAKALEMLKEFKLHSETFKDTLNIIMAHENLSDVYIKLKENNAAIQGLWKGIILSKKINSNYDCTSLYNKLGAIYLETIPKRDSALFYLSKSYNLSDLHGFVDVKLSSSEKLVALYNSEKNYKQAIHYLQIAKSLSEETINKENNQKVDKLEFEYSEKIQQKELLLLQKKREIFFIVGIVLLFLSSVIILLMFKLQKSKSLKRVAENQLLAKKLEEKNKALTNNAIQMLQTSEILQSTHKELSDLESKSGNQNNKILSQIILDLKRNTQSFNKKEFEKLFLEIDGDFYKRLLKEYPELTKNELRLCAFMRLNLSSKEISSITQQTPHSIVVARSRLRKKINLEENKSLTNFLLKF